MGFFLYLVGGIQIRTPIKINLFDRRIPFQRYGSDFFHSTRITLFQDGS